VPIHGALPLLQSHVCTNLAACSADVAGSSVIDKVVMLNTESSRLISCHRATITTSENESMRLERPMSTVKQRYSSKHDSALTYRRCSSVQFSFDRLPLKTSIGRRRSYTMIATASLCLLDLSLYRGRRWLCCVRQAHVAGRRRTQTLRPPSSRALRLFIDTAALRAASRQSIRRPVS